MKGGCSFRMSFVVKRVCAPFEIQQACVMATTSASVSGSQTRARELLSLNTQESRCSNFDFVAQSKNGQKKKSDFGNF